MHAAPRPPSRFWAILLWAASVALTSTAAQAQEGPHLSYSGDTGPAHWASEDPAYALCGAGTSAVTDRYQRCDSQAAVADRF